MSKVYCIDCTYNKRYYTCGKTFYKEINVAESFERPAFVYIEPVRKTKDELNEKNNCIHFKKKTLIDLIMSWFRFRI